MDEIPGDGCRPASRAAKTLRAIHDVLDAHDAAWRTGKLDGATGIFAPTCIAGVEQAGHTAVEAADIARMAELVARTAKAGWNPEIVETRVEFLGRGFAQASRRCRSLGPDGVFEFPWVVTLAQQGEGEWQIIASLAGALPDGTLPRG
ncbi:MAG: hypothetical protein ACYTGX_14920 [Planctomycetota bacterium]|jgi:ketosteroid isomerase-like protein